MIALTLAEVATATGGRLDQGTDPDAVVTGAVTLDSRAVQAGDLYVALAGERVDGHDFAEAAVAAGAVAVLAARPVGVPAVLVNDPTTALGRLARAVRERLPDLTVIGVTGSVGKTSTKDLMAAVLTRAGETVAAAGSFNTELGVPLTTLRVTGQTRFLVAEMGARGIGHIAYLCQITRPDVAVVLNVGTAHLGAFGDMQATATAKGELVEALEDTGLAVLNADDPLVAAMAERTDARLVFTGSGPTAQIRAEQVVLDEQARAGFLLLTPGGAASVQLSVHGAHQVANALAAAAVGIEAGLTVAEVALALSAAGPASRWRMEVSRRDDGLLVINDAYNANPESMAAALRALIAMSPAGAVEAMGRPWAVLGEMLELGPDSVAAHQAIGRLAVEVGVAGLITVGPGAAAIGEAARAASSGVQVLAAADLEQALDLVQQNVRRTDIVLVKASRSVGLERLAAALLADPKAASTRS